LEIVGVKLIFLEFLTRCYCTILWEAPALGEFIQCNTWEMW